MAFLSGMGKPVSLAATIVLTTGILGATLLSQAKSIAPILIPSQIVEEERAASHTTPADEPASIAGHAGAGTSLPVLRPTSYVLSIASLHGDGGAVNNVLFYNPLFSSYLNFEIAETVPATPSSTSTTYYYMAENSGGVGSGAFDTGALPRSGPSSSFGAGGAPAPEVNAGLGLLLAGGAFAFLRRKRLDRPRSPAL